MSNFSQWAQQQHQPLQLEQQYDFGPLQSPLQYQQQLMQQQTRLSPLDPNANQFQTAADLAYLSALQNVSVNHITPPSSASHPQFAATNAFQRLSPQGDAQRAMYAGFVSSPTIVNASPNMSAYAAQPFLSPQAFAAEFAQQQQSQQQHQANSIPSPSTWSNVNSTTVSPNIGQTTTMPQFDFTAQQRLVGTGVGMGLGQNLKRVRRDEAEDAEEHGEGAKTKPLGACGRCKGLKVRCEFPTDSDTCRRCFNAGQECSIPGRKKRRPPPKREHLIKQIQDQASQIQKLIAQLEASNSRQRSSSNSNSQYTQSATSPSMLSSRALSSPKLVLSPDEYPHTGYEQPGADVQEWINKARESIQSFEGLIGMRMGGAGLPMGLVVEGELEEDEGEEEWEEEWEEVDGAEVVREEREGGEALGGGGEAHGHGHGGDGFVKKKDSGGKEKLATMPPEASPFGLMAKLSLKSKKVGGRTRVAMGTLGSVDGMEVKEENESTEGEASEEDVGVANDGYFRPSPAPDPKRAMSNSQLQYVPHILQRGIVSPQEVEKLFMIYFDYMNLSLSLLDPVLYTAQKTIMRSPFLFTVICAIASRYYPERPDLYPLAMDSARLAAGTALISGQKNVEMVQAYILLSLYPVPTRRWEDDRGWIYLGLAIRVATDLNLHHPTTAKPLNELHAREMLNRTRAWLNCFNVDRSTASQYGKTPIIKNTDFVANHSENWWSSSEFNMKGFDVHICCYNAELRTMAGFVGVIYSDPNHPTGLDTAVDFEKIATETDEQLMHLGQKWLARIEQTDQGDPQTRFRSGLLKLAFSYARLVALSYGFQHAFGKGQADDNPFLLRCFKAASDVVNSFVDEIGVANQRVYLKHGPEAQSVFVTFASSFLVKLLQPKFASYLTTDQRFEIRRLVQKVIDLLASPDVSIDDRHGPKLYARFLRGLLARPMAQVEQHQSGALKRNPSSRASQKQQGPAEQYPFPDTSPSNHPSPSSRHSISPRPSSDSISFDQFAPGIMGVDPFVSRPAAGVDPNALGMNMADLFQPPLPYDDEFMQSVQSLDQTQIWTAFNWMDEIQPTDQNINIQPGYHYNQGASQYGQH